MKRILIMLPFLLAVQIAYQIAYSWELSGQSLGTSEVLADLQQCVERANNHFKDNSKGNRLTRDIDKTVNGLIERWEGVENKDLPKEYLLTLEADCELLRQAIEESNDEKAAAMLQDVYADLDVKLKQARKIIGAAGTLGSKVRVTVKTRKEAREVGGYLVRCNPRRRSAQQSAMFVFNNPTSPTEKDLPPGNFVMWLETQDGVKVVSRDITIGGNGETTETIVIDVP